MREGAGKPGKPREGSSQAELGNAWPPLPPLDFAFSAALAGGATPALTSLSKAAAISSSFSTTEALSHLIRPNR